jgi:hypothetical protein
MNRPPKKASGGTWLVGSGAREASHVAMAVARSRSAPLGVGVLAPKNRGALDAHRRSDDHCSGDEKPRAFAALTACRVPLAVIRAYPQSDSAYAMASSV